ncbi:MAG TPA: peptide MFS transporter [Allosphingosinicella sp.]
MATSPTYVAEGKTFLGHPRGLFVLFFAEMWERFSYYGMRALLILYLTKHWLYSDGDASIIYGAYTALVYITPVIGGYLADRYLGQRKAVAFGAVLLTIGHCFMAFEGNGSGHQNDPALNIFWLALAFIIVGSGFLKANISVIVGQLYPRTDVRRDGAYTIFYIGINLGAFIGTLIAGYLGETYGWGYGFGAAGIGMLLGLLVFIWGKPALLGRGEPRDPARLKQRVAGMPLEWLIYLAGIVTVGIVWLLIQYQALVGSLLGIAGALLVAYVLYTAVVKLPREDRDRIFAAMSLILGSILFWALFEQAGSSLNLFADRYVDAPVPASVLQAINPGYIILLGPVFAALWTFLGRRGLEPSAPAKFGLALIQLGAGFLVLVAGATAVGVDVPTPVLFIFLIYLLHTTGELCLSPVGLSAMNRLAPAHMASLIMGTWFFASATGNFAAGLIAAATGSEHGTGEGAAKEVVLGVYSQIGWISVAVGVGVILISPLIKRLMHLDTLKDADHAMAGQSELAEPIAPGTRTQGELKAGEARS